jgi:hypothetical protein
MDKLLKKLHSKSKKPTNYINRQPNNVTKLEDVFDDEKVVWRHTIDELKEKLQEAEDDNMYIFENLESQLDYSNSIEDKHNKLKALVKARDGLQTIPENRIIKNLKSVKINEKLDLIPSPKPPKRTTTGLSQPTKLPTLTRRSSSPSVNTSNNKTIKPYLKRKKST